MNWRARFALRTEAVLTLGNVLFKKIPISILPAPIDGAGENQRLVEILLDPNTCPTIEDAYVLALDTIEELMDRFCLVSYSQATYSLISVCKEKVNVEEEFDVIQFNYFKERTLNNISPESLTFDAGEIEEGYMRLLRLGLIAESQEQKLLKYFSLLEQVATNESKENIIKKCDKCGESVDTGMKKTNHFITDMLGKYNIEKKECESIKSYRGRIAHGGGRRSQDYFLQVDTFSARIEGPTFKEILNRTGRTPDNGVNVHMPGYPINKNTFRFEKDGSLTGIGGVWKSRGLFSIIEGAQNNSARFGVPTEPGNKPLTPEKIALPDLAIE